LNLELSLTQSKSLNSTGKCRNCKARRRDPGLNPGPHNFM